PHVPAPGHRPPPALVGGGVGGARPQRAVAGHLAALGLAGERAQGRAYAMAALVQPPDAVGADEAGAAGDENELVGHARETDIASAPVPRLTTLSRSLAGRVVVVTGAASGMGRATAHLLADEGAAVGIVDRDARALARVAEEIAGAGAEVHAVTADVAEDGAPARVVDEIRSALGPI